MGEAWEDQFEISFFHDLKTNYLVVSVPKDQKILNDQMQIMEKKFADGFLYVELREKNGCHALYYDVASMVPWSKIMKNQKLTCCQYFDIFLAMLRVVRECSDTLLHVRSILFHEDYIFMDPQQLQPKLVYVPIEFHQEPGQSIRQMFVRLLSSKLRYDKNGVLQELLREAEQNEIKLIMFERRLIEMRDVWENEEIESIETQDPWDEGLQSQKMVDMQEQTQPQPMAEMSESIGLTPERHSSPDHFSDQVNEPSALYQPQEIPYDDRDYQGMGYSPDGSTYSEPLFVVKYDYATIIMAVVMQMTVTAVITLAIYRSGFLSNVGHHLGITLGFFTGLIMLIILSFLYWKIVLLKSSKYLPVEEVQSQAVDDKPHDLFASHLKREIRSKHLLKDYGFDEDMMNAMEKDANGSQDYLKTFLSGIGMNSNECMMGDFPKYPYFERRRGELIERIVLTGSNIVIGSVLGYSDHVFHDHEIDQIHAEVTTNNGRIVIRDLDSKNGTYVNHTRLVARKAMEIHHGDTIHLANIEMAFHIPERENSIFQ